MWDRNDQPDKMCHCYRRLIRIFSDPVHISPCTDRMATLCICGRWSERHFRLRVGIGIGHPENLDFEMLLDQLEEAVNETLTG